jgi:hypothetical protein
MTKKIKDLAVALSKWTDRDGNEKTNWINIGSIMEKDDGGKFMILSRTFNPAGVPNPENKDSLIVSMFDVKPKDQSAAEKTKDAFSGTEEEIPF